MTLPPGSDIRRVSTAERNRRIWEAWDSGCFTKLEIARICGIGRPEVETVIEALYARKRIVRTAYLCNPLDRYPNAA